MKKLKKVVSTLLTVGLLTGMMSTMGVSAQETDDMSDDVMLPDYTVTKISNPGTGPRDADGLFEGGDRSVGYTWRMAERGDAIYIATYRNLLSGIVPMFSSFAAQFGLGEDVINAAVDAFCNGEYPHPEDTDGAYIVKYDKTTGEFTKLFTLPNRIQLRMAVTYGDNVYFGTYSSDPTKRQYLYRCDMDDNITEVFSTSGGMSLRANCVYDDHLFFAGADERETLAEGDEAAVKVAILRMDNDDDTVWKRVADYKDFGEYAFDSAMKDTSGAPVWELSDFNGYIYMTMPNSHGFAIFRGHPAADGETANEYGWYWEEVSGFHNGINNPGLSDDPNGTSNPYISIIGSTFVFNNELYAFDFDHTVAASISGGLNMANQFVGADVKASVYLKNIYEIMKHPQSLWKMDNETGKFEKCEEFSKLMEGTCNEYVWRAGEYDGEMYIGTMDAAVNYNYFTKFTNGSFVRMSADEWKDQLNYIGQLNKAIANSALMKLRNRIGEKCRELKELSDKVLSMLNDMDSMEVIDTEAMADFKLEYEGLKLKVAELSASIGSKTIDIDAVSVLSMIKSKVDYIVSGALLKAAADKVMDAVASIDWEGIDMYMYISDAVRNNNAGFDLIKTADGVNFEVITDDGFGDKYNYGVPAFLATNEGLYIGTANPFYGGQLYLLTNDFSTEPSLVSDTIELGEEAVVNLNAKGGAAPYRYSVTYKKAGSTKWVVAAKNTEETSVSFVPRTATAYDVRVTAKDSYGNAITKRFVLNVTAPLTNKSKISAETITLGEKVRIFTKAIGGAGDYTYTIKCKKASSSVWRAVDNLSEHNTAAFVPAVRTEYDICVAVTDKDNNVDEKYFKVKVE